MLGETIVSSRLSTNQSLDQITSIVSIAKDLMEIWGPGTDAVNAIMNMKEFPDHVAGSVFTFLILKTIAVVFTAGYYLTIYFFHPFPNGGHLHSFAKNW